MHQDLCNQTRTFNVIVQFCTRMIFDWILLFDYEILIYSLTIFPIWSMSTITQKVQKIKTRARRWTTRVYSHFHHWFYSTIDLLLFVKKWHFFTHITIESQRFNWNFIFPRAHKITNNSRSKLIFVLFCRSRNPQRWKNPSSFYCCCCCRVIRCQLIFKLR